MNDLKVLLDNTVGDVPVSRIDLDQTIIRMRRKVRWRRAGATVLSVAMLGGVIVAGNALIPKAPPQNTHVPAVVLAEPDEQIAARLSQVVQDKMRELLPGTEFLEPEPGVAPFAVKVWRPDGVPPELPWNNLRSKGDVRDAAGTGNVDVIIGRTEDDPASAMYCLGTKTVVPEGGTCAGAGTWPGAALGALRSCAHYAESADSIPGCEDRTGPNGETIVVVFNWTRNGTKHEWRVDVSRPDGTAIVMIAGNYGRATEGQREQPSLTIDQMIAIATLPALTIYP